MLNVSQAAKIRSFLRFMARFKGAIVSHLAKASTQTLDLLKEKIIITELCSKQQGCGKMSNIGGA